MRKIRPAADTIATATLTISADALAANTRYRGVIDMDALLLNECPAVPAQFLWVDVALAEVEGVACFYEAQREQPEAEADADQTELDYVRRLHVILENVTSSPITMDTALLTLRGEVAKQVPPGFTRQSSTTVTPALLGIFEVLDRDGASVPSAWEELELGDASSLDGEDGTYYLARANHTGTQLANTISNFDTQVRTSRLDQMAAPNTDLSLASHKLTNVTDGTAATDAATVAQVDAARNGLSIKPPVRVATTTTLPACTYANGTAGVGATLTGNSNGALAAQDGVTLVLNDILLVKDQAAGLQNGFYKVTQVGSAGTPFILTRTTDSDTAAELVPGSAAWVNEGTANADKRFTLTTNATITIGTTALVFVQDSALAASPSGSAGGDLGGTYPNPTVAAIHETSGPTKLTIGNVVDGEFLKRVGSTIVSDAGGGGGATDFTDLGDVPASYTGEGEKFVAVKSDETGLEFVAGPAGGSVDIRDVWLFA